MLITDEQYKWLAEQSYWVEEGKEDVRYHPEEGELYNYNPKDKSLGQYQVLEVEDNTVNGMQAMAVAPVVNGKVDTSQVIIAYAGTNAADEHDRDTDVQMVIGGDTNTLRTDTEKVRVGISTLTIPVDTTITDSQLVTAQRFYDEIQKKYPHANLTTTGHSLGAYLALIIASENRIPATTFNGPDPIRGMSDEAIAWIKANQDMYNNYRIRYDGIGNFGAYFGDKWDTDELGISRFTDAKKRYANPIDNHMLFAYQFDSKGRVIDKNGKIIGTQYLTSYAYLMSLEAKYQMSRLRDLKSKWKKSGGKLSSSEKIFLDAAQGQILASSMAQTARLGADDVKACRDSINQQVEELWSGIDFSSYRALAYYEVEALFASQGITYSQFVTEFQDYTQEKVTKMEEQATSFESLNTSIQAHIEEVVAADKKLAGEFKEWQTQM